MEKAINFIDSYDFEYTELRNLLLKNLPHKVLSWEVKEFDKERTPHFTNLIIDTAKFIEYNTTMISFIVIDIDNNNLYETMELAAKLGIEPTIGCQTTKGCHLFYALSTSGKVYFQNKKAMRYLRVIKRAITWALGADIMGSHRVSGIWRNPLTHEHIFNENLFFNLNDFKDTLKAYNNREKTIQQQFSSYVNKTKIINDNFKYELGNRNNFIFYSALTYSKNRNLTEEQIYQYIKNLSYIEALKANIEEEEESKLLATARSVYKYNIENRNNTTTTIKKVVNEGVMGFEKIKNLTAEEYKEEVKLRQQLAALNTHEILEQKGITKMTKIEAALKMAKEKELKTSKIISNFITGDGVDDYKKKNGTWNYKSIAKALKMKPHTVSKHIKKLEQ